MTPPAMTIEQAIDRVRQVIPFTKIITEEKIVGHYRTVLTTIPRYLSPPARILDFGAGQCVKPAVLSLMGYDCHAADDLNDPWHLVDGNRTKIEQFARDCGVKFVRLDAGASWPWREGEFDMLMLHDVLEHLHDSPRDLLNSLLSLVKPRGYLFVTVPNAGNLKKRIKLLLGATNLPPYDYFYWQQGPWRGHVREYVRADLAQLAEFLKLDVAELRSCHNMIGHIRPALRPIWRAATALVPGWRDSWLLVARKRPGWAPTRELPQGHPLRAALAIDVG